MKNNLWTFGCSFTEIFLERISNKTKEEILKFYLKSHNKKDLKSWQEIVSDKLNLTLNNFGFGGRCNYEIFQSICNNSNKFKKGDIIIIQWTDVTRTRFSPKEHGKEDKWIPISSGFINNHDEKSYIDLLTNRMSDNYKEEIISFMIILNRLSKEIGCNLYYWTIDSFLLDYLKENKKINHNWLFYNELIETKINSFYNNKMFNDMGMIYDETGFNDFHPGIKGNKNFGDLVTIYIKEGLHGEDFSYR